MPNKTFIKAATSLAIFNAIDSIKDIALKHNKTEDMEYIDNMFIISMIGYVIASEQDKKEILDFLMEIASKRNREEQECLINNAKDLL